MAGDVLVMRAARERDTSAAIRRKVDADLERVRRAAEEIRQMTRNYQERLEGRYGRKP